MYTIRSIFSVSVCAETPSGGGEGGEEEHRRGGVEANAGRPLE